MMQFVEVEDFLGAFVTLICEVFKRLQDFISVNLPPGNCLATPVIEISEHSSKLPLRGRMDSAHVGLRGESPTVMGRF